MARLRTWAEFEARGLWPGERKLVDACKAGEPCILGDGIRPDGPSPERSIRADLLRYLILGGCETCRTDEFGMDLAGAFILGQLNVSNCIARGKTVLVNCVFLEKLEADQAHFQSLILIGSCFPGLNASGTEVRGDLALADIDAEGEVRLAGARIGGQINCVGSRLGANKRYSLILQGAKVSGDVFMSPSCANGEVSLFGMQVGGQLDFRGATFGVPEMIALNAQYIQVKGGLIWRGVNIGGGQVYFSSSRVGDLMDDLGSWPDREKLNLDGFEYGRISNAFVDAPGRLEWLSRGARRKDDRDKSYFFPQPYTQLAKVLREMGHDRTALSVLIARENLLRRQMREDARKQSCAGLIGKLRRAWAYFCHPFHFGWGSVLWALTGYGYAQWRSFWGLVMLFILAWVMAWGAWEEGSFAPNDGAVLVSEAWQEFADNPVNPAAAWSAEGAPGMDWDSFNAFAYGLDLVVPILDLGQTEAWAPSKDRGFWGTVLWCNRWVLSTLGWVVTALGAAAITGIIRRE